MYSDNQFGKENPVTVSGRPISELGKGLPFPRTGDVCTLCNGKGFHKAVQQIRKRCPSCDSSSNEKGGWSCRRCGNEGFVISAKAYIQYFICDRCSGTGQVEVFNPLIPQTVLELRR